MYFALTNTSGTAVIIIDAIHFGINVGPTLAVAWNLLWPIDKLVHQVSEESIRVQHESLKKRLGTPWSWPPSGVSIMYIAWNAWRSCNTLHVRSYTYT